TSSSSLTSTTTILSSSFITCCTLLVVISFICSIPLTLFKFSILIIRFLRIAFKYLTQNRIISYIGEVIMKYFFYALGLISLALFIPNLNKTTFANEEENKTEPIVIATYEEDITGDGIKETIELKGVLLSEDSGFFHQVWADITSEHDKEWRISYESGYDPTLS